MYNPCVLGRNCNSSFLAKHVLLNNKVALENLDERGIHLSSFGYISINN
jgi:hypothetical protein